MHPTVHNEYFARLAVEAALLGSQLSSVIMWVFNCDRPFWLPFIDDLALCSSKEIVCENLILMILEHSDIRSLLLHHFHGALNGLHMLAVLDVHPVDLPWHLVHSDISGSIVVKDPLVAHLILWVPNCEGHIVCLPDIIVMDVFDATALGCPVYAVQVGSREG
jgi:hypothetical protein